MAFETYQFYILEVAVFEPGAKHTFDQAAGKGVANPTAALLASAKLLQVILSSLICFPVFTYVEMIIENVK